MKKQATYGLPLNPRHLLEQLKGASFCISFATRAKLGAQLDQAIELVGENRLLLVDNGAFSMHKQGVDARDETYLEDYAAWANDILDRCPQAVAVLPDIIGGTEAENAQLASDTACMFPEGRVMAVWHMHESLDYLTYLCDSFGYIAIGSSGQYWKPGTEGWHARMREAFAAIDAWEAAGNECRPRIHLMRAQSLAHLYPVDTSDSCNVAMNHGRTKHTGEGHVARLASKASAAIRASSGEEAYHQVERPLLGHVATKGWQHALLAKYAALDAAQELPLAA